MIQVFICGLTIEEAIRDSDIDPGFATTIKKRLLLKILMRLKILMWQYVTKY